MSDVKVTVTVEADGQRREFTATTTTDANPLRTAEGVLSGVHSDAQQWLCERLRFRNGRSGAGGSANTIRTFAQ